MGSQSKELTILFVNADEDDLMMTRGHLSRVRGTRYALDWCHSIDEAVPLLRENRHDACLLGYRIGNRIGLEIFPQLGNLIHCPPIIMLASDANSAIDQNAMQLGAVGFLDKASVTAQDLERTIRYAIQRRRHERELLAKNEEIEKQNHKLISSYRKLEDVSETWAGLLRKLSRLSDSHIIPLQELLGELREAGAAASKDRIREAERRLFETLEFLRPLTALSKSGPDNEPRRVLLAETDRKQQMITKMALRSTGAEVDVVTDERTARQALAKSPYDVLLVNQELIQLADHAKRANPDISPIFITTERASNYLAILREYPFLSNIVSRNEEDRSFATRTIISTVKKLLTRDIFGLEKYLSWGVELQARTVVGSGERSGLLDEMEGYFRQFGIRTTMVSKAMMVTEELLSNAIYDAPRDASGRPHYNHLPRTVPVSLTEEQQGTLRYGCDGSFLAVSVEDPFGGLDRRTILDYLESCYSGRPGTLQGATKGGAGIGLFQIMESSALFVINVRPSVKTEVIALMHVDPEQRASNAATSFHFFKG